MVRLIDINAELRQTAELLETLVVHQRGVIPRIIVIVVCTVYGRKQRTGAGKERLCRRGFLALFLYDDLLRIGNDDIEIRVIDCVQNRSGLVKKVKFDVGIKHTCILRRYDLCFVKGHDLTERLEDGLIRCKDQRIVTEPFVPRILFRKQEFIKDAGGHEDGFTKSHRKCVDIVRITLPVLLHLLEERVGLLFGQIDTEPDLTSLIHGIIGCVGEAVSSVTPVVEHLIDLLVIHEFLHKNIHLQRLKLRLPQEGVEILLAVVVGEEFSREVIITGANLSSVRRVVIPQLLVEGKIRIKSCRHLTHLHFQRLGEQVGDLDFDGAGTFRNIIDTLYQFTLAGNISHGRLHDHAVVVPVDHNGINQLPPVLHVLFL